MNICLLVAGGDPAAVRNLLYNLVKTRTLYFFICPDILETNVNKIGKVFSLQNTKITSRIVLLQDIISLVETLQVLGMKFSVNKAVLWLFG